MDQASQGGDEELPDPIGDMAPVQKGLLCLGGTASSKPGIEHLRLCCGIFTMRQSRFRM